MRLTFLGATQTVTGSRHLVELDSVRVLVDCGLFQGSRELKERNWQPLAVPALSLDAVILTHAHLDHSGYLPRLVKEGFNGPIYCTPATADLCKILWLDSAHLMVRDAEFANRHGYSRHKPATPLYDVPDADAAIRLLRPTPWRQPFTPARGVAAQYLPAGHILGASMVRLEHRRSSVLFSGDLGRPSDPMMPPPAAPPAADFVVVESTYGNRRHDHTDVEEKLATIIGDTARRGGAVLVPAFAVGRAQALLFHLSRLKRKNRLPHMPIYLDSPMAVDASDVLCAHRDAHKLAESECRRVCSVAHYVRSSEESKALDRQTMPMVLISASGMATGGRILHHLKAMAPDPRNTILLTGFQASGTRGDQLMKGAQELNIHGQTVAVRARVENLPMLSAHADADEILSWLGQFPTPPKKVFVVHGEESAASALAASIRNKLSWSVEIPTFGQSEMLSF